MIPDEIRDGKHIDSQREPDASSKHRRARYPGVIIEVCYSQKGRCVSHLANEYILNTDGSVNAVVALYIDYKGSKKRLLLYGDRNTQPRMVRRSFKRPLLSRRCFVTSFPAPKKNSQGRCYCRALSIDYARELESVVGLKLRRNSQARKMKDKLRGKGKLNEGVEAAIFSRTLRQGIRR
ncbi:hypothetical protein N7481_012698, partial [Penicillium waksmanii]|uniref:uncharacterized protein n=1 Tax=Penicillium waksmanii TaxID=69791 RepID=UPI0025467118